MRLPARAGPLGVGCAALALVAASCGPGGGGDRPGARDVVVEFVYAREGGLCATPDGGGATCRFEVVVRDDGTWSATGTPPPEESEGRAPLAAATELASIFDRVWRGLTERPFTGVCPVAYDGSELSYAVRRTTPGEEGGAPAVSVREVRSCVYDLSHTNALDGVSRLDEAWAALGLPR